MDITFESDNEAILEALALNDRQKEAVLINDRPLLILAGAGSGKTRTIISKIVYDILALNVDPHNILAVTFTNKAAEEMRNRLSLYLGDRKASEVEIKTFHSFGAAFLRCYAPSIGLNPAFNIYDDQDALSLLRPKYPDSKAKELKPIIENILSAKERGYNVNNYLEYFDSHTDVYEYFKVYDKALRESGNIDLPELISLPTSILSKNTEIRNDVQHHYKRIFVDEYQDTNASQFALLKCLVGNDNIICVVGDDDQSIYGFRGSEVEHILEFTNFFKGAATVKLEENYRSTKSIIALAASLIKHNKERHEKTLWTGNQIGEKPSLYIFDTESEEAAFVANTLRKENDYNSSAILYRTNAQGGAFERALSERKMVYHVLRGNSFYERADIKDAVALMALSINKYDVVAFMRIANKPTRGLGDNAQTTIMDFAASYCTGDLYEALKTVKLLAKARSGATELLNCLEHSRELLGKEDNGEYLRTLLLESGLYAYYADLDEKEGNTTDSHTDALDALIGQIDELPKGEEGIISLMEQMALVSQQDTKHTEGIALSTVHGVKGLEFDNVFITGLEDGLFPLSRSESVEEERRLMYVAITRARKKLTLTLALSRFRYGRRENEKFSPYLSELDIKNLDVYNYSSISDERVKNSLLNKTNENRFRDNESTFSYSSSYNKNYDKSNSSSSENLYKNHRETNDYPFSFENIIRRDEIARLKKASELENSGKVPQSRTQKVSEEEQKSLPFKKGDRVEHPDSSYGKGIVLGLRTIKGRYVMDIRFDSGRQSVFPVFNTKVHKI